MIKYREIERLHVETCPMKEDSCFNCPFYCGITFPISTAYRTAVLCGWDRVTEVKLRAYKEKQKQNEDRRL